ncbi:MAG: DUF1186 domain-containing protein [Treponema sp.]|jgi:hypothetical protein|nr:DUF1186 domain-containing protein [Treponema sp.]
MLAGLSDEQIVSLLKSHTLWSKKACREIISRQNDFAPLLLDLLDKAAFDPPLAGNEEPHIPAALLLAQMREPRAYPKLIKLMSYDEETVDILWGDFLTQWYTLILRDTFNGDTALLAGVIENSGFSPWSRVMALDTLPLLHLDGRMNRKEISEYFRRLIHKAYAGKINNDERIVISSVAFNIRALRLEEFIDDVKSIYDKGGIDESYCDGKDKYVKDFFNPDHAPMDLHIDDTIKELEKWAWFNENKYFGNSGDEPYDGDDDEPQESIGRNEPCPCGSGMKYKNCCMKLAVTGGKYEF